jgi:ATP-binding cassette subfamily F protein 3
MEAFERQNQLHTEIEAILKKLETEYTDELINKLSDKQHEFEALDGYSIEYRAHEIMAGLGFSETDTQRTLSEFSGGWRMRVMLARILLQSPDILLLDEPTNHLDLPSIKWLETYLQAFEGAIVIVSHDRYFLDRVVKKIVESRKGKLIPYAGNYSFYTEEKGLREEIQSGQYKNQQAKIKQEERLIERFRAKASKAKMAQSRIKALEKMERVDDVDDDNPSVNFSFKFSKQSGRHVIRIEDLTKAYPGVPIVHNATATIEKGDKIALIGANGRGKSTVLRIIAGADKKFTGMCETGHNVTQTFFAQHQLEALHLFTGDDVFKKIKVLSGGEKSRVALAKALTADANFLILDEPTNHLDIASVNILIQALKQFEGTFIVVSHDRYLLDNVANKIWFIEDQEIKEYPGTYAEYEEWNSKRVYVPKTVAPAPKKEAKIEEKPKAQIDNKGNELKKLNQTLQKLEEDIAELEKSVKDAEAELSKEEIYTDSEKLSEANRRYQQLSPRLLKAQAEWERMAEEIMELEGK